MDSNKLLGGTIHQIPTDLYKTLMSSKSAIAKWQGLTPLARNEWICWVVSVKQQKTRDEHVTRVVPELLSGKRRPCCWIGCIHRTDKQLSPSVKAIMASKSQKK